MMRAVAEVTGPLGVKTIVSLNPIMVDGTGMCGGCRVTVDGVTPLRLRRRPRVRGRPRRLRASWPIGSPRTATSSTRRSPTARPAGSGCASRRTGNRTSSRQDRRHDRAARDSPDRRRRTSAAPLTQKERMAIDRVGDAGAGPDRPGDELPRGQPRPHLPARDARGRALPAVPEAVLRRRLPGPRQHPALHQAAPRGRPARPPPSRSSTTTPCRASPAGSAPRRASARASASAARRASPSRSAASSASSPTGR